MRAIIKLEKRFRRALANLDTDADKKAGANENAMLSKQIEKLEAQSADKDGKINALSTEVKALTQNGGDSAKAVKELEQARAAAIKETADIQDLLTQAKTDEAAALKQISVLEDKLQKADVADLNDKLAAAEAKIEEQLNNIASLRGSSREIRAGLKDNVVNAENINEALEAELEALQAQRETDLTEVNAVLAKLAPLVEGK
jgi:chromosome segregation ATPase